MQAWIGAAGLRCAAPDSQQGSKQATCGHLLQGVESACAATCAVQGTAAVEDAAFATVEVAEKQTSCCCCCRCSLQEDEAVLTAMQRHLLQLKPMSMSGAVG